VMLGGREHIRIGGPAIGAPSRAARADRQAGKVGRSSFAKRRSWTGQSNQPLDFAICVNMCPSRIGFVHDFLFILTNCCSRLFIFDELCSRGVREVDGYKLSRRHRRDWHFLIVSPGRLRTGPSPATTSRCG